LKGGDEVLNILDENVLMLESVVHFLLDVAAVLLELTASTILKVFYPLVFTFDLSGDTVVELSLPCETLLFFDLKLFLNLGRLLMQGVEDLAFLLYTGVPFSVNASFNPAEIVADRVELVLK
jgi:hypothetical protein